MTDSSVKASVWNQDKWAWEERPQTVWCQNRLKELLANICVPELENGTLCTTSVTSVEGDATNYTRKGKIRYFFDFETRVGVKLEVIEDDETKTASGEFVITMAGDEPPSEWQYTFKPIGKSKLTKQLVQQSSLLKCLIEEKMGQFIEELSQR
ncbi:hypothetical protein GEMRC1_007834 [Eukaryota sp. GEM-RC1]